MNYRGELRIVAQIVNRLSDVKPIGYVVMVEKNKLFKSYTVPQTKILLKKFKFVNAKLEGDEIVNTECANERLVKVDTNLHLLERNKITILGEISDSDADGLKSFRILDENFKIVDVFESDLVRKLSDKTYSFVNAKIVTRGDTNKTFVSGIKSDFTKIEKSKVFDFIQDSNTVQLSSEDKQRHARHREKLLYHLRKTMENYVLLPYKEPNFLFNKELCVKSYKKGNPDSWKKEVLMYYPKKDAEIYIKEILLKYVSDEEDKKLLKKNYMDSRKLSDIQQKWRGNRDFYSKELGIIYSCIFQYSLYIPEIKEKVYSKLSKLTLKNLAIAPSPYGWFHPFKCSESEILKEVTEILKKIIMKNIKIKY